MANLYEMFTLSNPCVIQLYSAQLEYILGINRHQRAKDLHVQEGHVAQAFTSGKYFLFTEVNISKFVCLSAWPTFDTKRKW